MIERVMAVAVLAALLLCSIAPIGTGEGAPSSLETPVMDGEIGEGEYERAADLSGGDFLLRWQVHGDTAFFAMSAITEGYLAIGFDPEFLMKGADMIVGWVDEHGNATVIDAYSSGQFGPVERDIDQGGTDDLMGSAGAVQGDWTVIEFSRALSTGDLYDNDIPFTGEIVVMWAIGGVFDPSTMPDDGGIGTISIDSGATSEGTPSYPYLLALVPLALAASIAAMLVLFGPAGLRKRGHLVLGSLSAGLVMCTALVVLIGGMDETASDLAWPLLIAAALIVACVLMGAAALRPGVYPWVKKGHVSSAAAAMVGLVWCLLIVFWL